MASLRRWVAWSFLIATIVAQGPHDHRATSHLDREEFGACDSPSPHWAGHEADASDPGPDSCPLCQHRLQPALIALAAAIPAPPSTPTAAEATVAHPPAASQLQLRCRAPPEA